MVVHRVEKDDGTVTQLIFVKEGDEDLKDAIKTWVQSNYPAITFEQLFDRLLKFQADQMIVSMQ